MGVTVNFVAPILKLICMVLLYRGVLGFAFESRKRWLAAGGCLILLPYVCFFLMDSEFLMKLVLIWYGIPILLPAFLFAGRKLLILSIGLCLFQSYDVANSLSQGIKLLIAKGDVTQVNVLACYDLALTGCIVVLAILTALLYRKRDRIYIHVKQLAAWYFWLLTLCLIVTQLVASYFGDSRREGQIIHGVNMVRNGMMGSIILLCFVLLMLLICQRRELQRTLALNARCIREQTEQYRLLSEGDRRLRKFRHDYNDHMAVLQQLAQGDAASLRRYIRDMQEMEPVPKLFCTGHIIGDAILNQYAGKCTAQQIDLYVDGTFPDPLPMPETDLCVLLSNGLKNAYEAALQCPGEKKIEVEIKNSVQGEWVFVNIRNTALRAPRMENGVLVTDKADLVDHGLGTQNMLEAARRNGGDVNWQWDEAGIMTTEMILRGKA